MLNSNIFVFISRLGSSFDEKFFSAMLVVHCFAKVHLVREGTVPGGDSEDGNVVKTCSIQFQSSLVQ